jgi:hypothetical protein
MIKRSLAVLAIAGAAALSLFAPAAQAAPAPAPPPVTVLDGCHHADTPTQTPGWIHGKSWVSSPCSQSIDVFLQRWRGFYWENVAIRWYQAPGEAIASWNCSGAGYYTYRTVTSYRDGQGNAQNVISGEVRYGC